MRGEKGMLSGQQLVCVRAEENRGIFHGMMVELGGPGCADFERDRRLYDTRRPLTVGQLPPCVS
jgi:hypothetical protein